METWGTTPEKGHLFRNSHQTFTNPKTPDRGDYGLLGKTSRHTQHMERHLERTMGIAMVGRDGSTQIRRGPMGSWTSNGKSLTRHDRCPDPPHHVYNGSRRPKTHGQSTVHKRYTTRSKTNYRTISEAGRLGKPTRQHEPSEERPIMDLLNRILDLAGDSTNPPSRHWQTNTKPHPRTVRNCSTGRARRYKAHNGTGHTSVMVDRDPNGRIVERRAIPRRRPTHTMYARTTNRVASSNGSHKAGQKGNRRHHPILAYLSHKRLHYK